MKEKKSWKIEGKQLLAVSTVLRCILQKLLSIRLKYPNIFPESKTKIQDIIVTAVRYSRSLSSQHLTWVYPENRSHCMNPNSSIHEAQYKTAEILLWVGKKEQIKREALAFNSIYETKTEINIRYKKLPVISFYKNNIIADTKWRGIAAERCS